MNDDDESSDWETEELPPLPTPKAKKHETEDQRQQQQADDDDGDEYWNEQQNPSVREKTDLSKVSKSNTNKGDDDVQSTAGVGGEPMFLVDLTELSDGQVHSKFDPNSVNDPVAVKRWRSKVEAAYDSYKSDATLIANRTVISCGTSVWRPALASLRKEKAGHYFCPIFPPTKSK